MAYGTKGATATAPRPERGGLAEGKEQSEPRLRPMVGEEETGIHLPLTTGTHAPHPAASTKAPYSADFVGDMEGLAEIAMYPALATAIVNLGATVFSTLAYVRYLNSGKNLKKLINNGVPDKVDTQRDQLFRATDDYTTAGALSIAASLIGSASAWAIREQLDKRVAELIVEEQKDRK